MGLNILIVIVSIIAFGGAIFGWWVDNGGTQRKNQNEKSSLNKKEN